jgi:protease-4
VIVAPSALGSVARPGVPPRKTGPGLFGWLVLVGFCGAGLAALVSLAVAAKRGGLGSGPRVGVVELIGPIADTSQVVRDARSLGRRDDLIALIVRIDSPGGSVAPSQELYDALREVAATKPVITSMGGMAASGGLWVALAGDEIFASGGSITGSIGVISQAPDLTGLKALIGIDMRTYKTGPYKDFGNMLRPVEAGEEEIYMDLLSDVYDQFVSLVAERRGLSRGQVLSMADGRVLSGRVAQQLGLVDRLGGLHAAAVRAAELGLEREAEREGRTRSEEERAEPIEPVLVYAEKPVPSVLELLGRTAGDGFSRGLSAAFESAARDATQRLSTPRVELR